jgi:hypothetical protein
MTDLNDTKNFAYYEALDEALEIAWNNIDMARDAANDIILGSRLKFASRALRCALEIYGELMEERAHAR